MKSLSVLLFVAMMAPVALAGLDPTPDSFGVYFDTAGNTNCVTAGAFQPTAAYLVLMNPSAPTDGFECSVSRTGVSHFVLSTTYNPICGPDAGSGLAANDYVCACPSDFPIPANGAVVLVTWSIMLQAPSELLFYIGPCSIPSLPGGLPVLTGDGVLRLGAVASGHVDAPVAAINHCWIGEEVNAYGAVKGLFR